ncbi:MAG: amidohydrolase [Cytophagales bacterium]|nr:MAG: amidohydrolase [Cytophagales bacterium]
MKKKILLLYVFAAILISCQTTKIKVDTILFNGIVYTVDKNNTEKEAFAIKDGKFIAVGTNQSILNQYEAKEMIDANKKAVFPSFNDAHCHFYGYGSFLQEANLVGITSFEQILRILKNYHEKNPDKKWIIGRGWDQNLWSNNQFPTKKELDKLFPNTPVYLSRIDIHAALVNQKALDLANINLNTPQPIGGTIEKENGELTGILIDNAMQLVNEKIPSASLTEIEKSLFDAQEKCFAVGLTSLADAGLDKKLIDIIDNMQKEKRLQMRIYAMVSNTPENRAYYLKKGIYKSDFLHIRSFKIFADGALGSRGACMLHPYHDRPKERGFLLTKPEEFEKNINEIAKAGFQVNTHCIGDSANKIILGMYAKVLSPKNDRRFRIEHAQVVQENDLEKFEKYAIIPSVQPTHATSDMFWAVDRLGKVRIKRAYSYLDLWKKNQKLALGSDFPVEDISPFYTFHAAVARQNADNQPEKGFQMENALSRQQTLRGMTIDAAFAAFEEKEKGSIEKDKFADFIILEKDIMKIDLKEIRQTKVIKTFVGGILAYERK